MRVKFESENLFKCVYPWTLESKHMPFGKKLNFYGIRKNFGYIFGRLPKLIYQRAKYGVCEADTWDLFITLCNFLSQTLEHLATEGISYPGRGEYDTHEKWQAKLLEMSKDWEIIGKFDELDDKYFDNLDSENYRDFLYNEELANKDKKARDELLDKALKDLRDNFDDLWD